jgi:hypothetical protein
MVSSLDSRLLRFFGFTEKDIKQIFDRPDLQILYSLMKVPRKRFQRSMVTNLSPNLLLEIYQHLLINSEVPITQNILDENISSNKGKNSKIKLLKNMFTYFSRNSTNDIVKPVLYIIENSEMLGDAILSSLVNDIVSNIPKIETTKYYVPCIQTLKRFLNSNVALHHILKTAEIDVSRLIPSLVKEKIRLSKRDKPTQGRIEKITTSCIDFKYTANLFEQMIAYLYLNKGYDYTFQVFNLILHDIGIDPEDFVYFCMDHFETPYPKIKLQPGCSCQDVKTKKSICDNPGLFEPNHFLNLECPEKCSPKKQNFLD